MLRNGACRKGQMTFQEQLPTTHYVSSIMLSDTYVWSGYENSSSSDHRYIIVRGSGFETRHVSASLLRVTSLALTDGFIYVVLLSYFPCLYSEALNIRRRTFLCVFGRENMPGK